MLANNLYPNYIIMAFKCSVFVLVLAVIGVQCEQVPQDSYLDALKKTQEADGIHDSRVAREDFSSSGYPDNSLGLTSGYDYTPKSQYGPPSSQYGPPSTEYSTGFGPSAPYPPSSYGHSVYGPPKPINMYNFAGPPQPHNLPTEHWLLDKLKFKLDLFTIGKLLLKLIIFKKIIKFIAIICLLLWLPKFQTKHMKMEDTVDAEDDEDEDDDEDRRRQFGRSHHAVDHRLNEITRFTMTALNAFKNKYPTDCQESNHIYCRFNSVVDTIDDQYPYKRIMKLYLTSDSTYPVVNNDQLASASNSVSDAPIDSAVSSATTEVNATIIANA